jgi:hypothetical protein
MERLNAQTAVTIRSCFMVTESGHRLTVSSLQFRQQVRGTLKGFGPFLDNNTFLVT